MGKLFLTYYFDWSDESIKKEDELSTKQSLCICNLILTLFHQIVLVSTVHCLIMANIAINLSTLSK